MFPLKDHEPSGSFPIITLLIIFTCALVLFLEISAPNTEAFIYQWSIVPSRINFLNLSSLTTFVTSIFLHGGLLHFGSNMWFLWIYGDNVESELGKIKYLLFFVAGGVVAGLLQYFFMFEATIPLLGASGAIAAVLGFYMVRFPKSRIETLVFYPFLSIVNLPSTFVLALWFITQVFSGAVSIVETAAGGGVAWWAHIGGFAFGYIVGSLSKKSTQYGEFIG